MRIAMHMLNRRQVLSLAGMAPLLAQSRPSVAAVVTEYRHWSHADVVVGRLLGGYSANNVHTPPRTRVVSLHTVQKPAGQDMAPDLAARFGFKLFPTIREALTLGGERLAVDAVVFIGEHGEYPTNELGQKLYPRYELFNEILEVYERSGRSVPTFFDKHLSYSWDKARTLWQRAQKLKVPMLAGSSIPVTVRVPRLELPLETELKEAVAVGYGDADAYGFHLLEALQCMIERRKGAETGVEWVEYREGDAVWKWVDNEGGWSRDLLESAASRNPFRPNIPLREESKMPFLFVMQYRDGLKAAGFILTRSGAHWSYAGRRAGGQVDSTYFGLPKPGRPLPHFDGLVKCIEDLFVTGKPPYPWERTVLTTGILAHLFDSKRIGARVNTPGLAVRYKAPVHAYFQAA